jgi:hypothetical protein
MRAALSFEKVNNIQHARGVAHLLVDFGRWQPAHLQREGEVLVNRLVGVKRVVLEHHGDVAILGIEIIDHAVADGDVAAGYRQESGNEIEGCRLAATRRADEGDELSVADG